MNLYRHFGLKLSPFESAPDPRFFYRSPAHAETLATLQFAVHAGKACCVVAADSGAGKTLVARMLCMDIGARSHVLWLHGLAQSGDGTDVSLYAPGEMTKALLDGPGQRISLDEWLRARRFESRAPLLVVDNADQLSEYAWRTLTAVLADEVRHPTPPNVILLGLPALLRKLTEAQLSRLRGRVFRVCTLPPLPTEHVAGYVRHRVQVAGGADAPVFTDDALTEIERLSRGLPAQVNQLCDNTLIDAFGEGRTSINAGHLLSVSRLAIRELPEPQIESAPLLPAPGANLPALPLPAPRRLVVVSEPTLPSISAPAPARPPRPVRPAQGLQPAGKPRNLDGRLQSLESRLAHALSVVRQARVVKNLTVPPKTESGDQQRAPARLIVART